MVLANFSKNRQEPLNQAALYEQNGKSREARQKLPALPLPPNELNAWIKISREETRQNSKSPLMNPRMRRPEK